MMMNIFIFSHMIIINIINIIEYIYNSIYYIITINSVLKQEKRNNELLRRELSYTNNLITLTLKRKENKDNEIITKLKKEILYSDIRNSGLLRRINDLKTELNKNINNDDLKKELQQEKINNINSTLILKHANERNYILTEKYKLLKLELEETKTIITCSICAENKINICCNPCGHTYCDKCINEINNCYLCRNEIKSFIKIYI